MADEISQWNIIANDRSSGKIESNSFASKHIFLMNAYSKPDISPKFAPDELRLRGADRGLTKAEGKCAGKDSCPNERQLPMGICLVVSICLEN